MVLKEKKQQRKSIGCKMRFLVGDDNGKTRATITTSKEEVDYQFQYLGEIKSPKNIKTLWIIILGWVNMLMNWFTQNQLKAHILQGYTIYELL